MKTISDKCSSSPTGLYDDDSVRAFSQENNGLLRFLEAAGQIKCQWEMYHRAALAIRLLDGGRLFFYKKAEARRLFIKGFITGVITGLIPLAIQYIIAILK